MKIGKVTLMNAKGVFFCKNNYLNPLRVSLTRDTDTKTAEQFENLLLFNDEINQNTHFAKLPSSK